MELNHALSLLTTAQQVSLAKDRDEITGILKLSARQLSGADGVTFVLRDGDQCYYVDEDAISPLWKGSRFPLEICISGWAMIHRQTVVIEDIYSDERVPHEAYRPTFVRSLAMIPVRSADPIAAIGAYWASPHKATTEELELLQWLADIAAVAIDKLQLIDALEQRILEYERTLAQLEEEVARREAAETQFLEAQKMEAIGNLAGSIAHDFNNLLSVISASADLAADDIEDTDALREHIDTISQATDSAASLTRQLLAFSRRTPIKDQVLDLRATVSRVSPMLERLLGQRVKLETGLDMDLAHVRFDPGHLEQIIMNLAVNARDAMPDGGTLTIAATNGTTVSPGSPAGEVLAGHVVLSVSDTGIGMDEDLRSRIFDPFFTTKPEGKGTGLGLSAVHSLLAASDGEIEVDSAPGQGTTFRVLIPAAPLPKDAGRTVPARESARRGRGTILLVEDDRSLLSLFKRVLEKEGYDVLAASTAEDAIARFRNADDDISLLVTDMSLPSMSGAALARTLTEMRSSLRVIFVSGYTQDEAIDFSRPNFDYLPKPVARRQLLDKIQEVLAR